MGGLISTAYLPNFFAFFCTETIYTMTLYNFIQIMQRKQKRKFESENKERKPYKWSHIRLPSGLIELFGMLGGFFLIVMSIFVFNQFQTMLLRNKLANFQSGRRLELHVSESRWTGIQGYPKLDRYYCSIEEDIFCGNSFLRLFRKANIHTEMRNNTQHTYAIMKGEDFKFFWIDIFIHQSSEYGVHED